MYIYLFNTAFGNYSTPCYPHKLSQYIFNDVINLRDRFTSVLTLKITPLNNTKRNKF